MLEYFNCYTSKKEFYNYEKLKQELNEHGLNIKDDENSIKEYIDENILKKEKQ